MMKLNIPTLFKLLTFLLLLSFPASAQTRKYIVTKDGTNSVIYLDNLPYNSTRSIQNRLAEEVWSEDLRTIGMSDADVLQRGIKVSDSLQKPLHLSRNYYTNRTIIIIGIQYLNIDGNGYGIQGAIPGFPAITSTTTPDTTLPTITDPGLMRGTCFYFTGNLATCIIRNIRFSNFRFAISTYGNIDSPNFEKINFSYCNVGIFCYAGSQNFTLTNCKSEQSANMFIGSSTRFPANSPYATNDQGVFTDGLTVQNVLGNTAATANKNIYWDAWFQASISRPTELTYTGGNPPRIYEYPTTSDYCNPSGWLVYCMMRSSYRNFFGPRFTNLNILGGLERGLVLMNSGVLNLEISGTIRSEDVHNPAYFTLGSAISGSVNANLFQFDNSASLLKFTFRGNGNLWDRLDMRPSIPTGDRVIDGTCQLNNTKVTAIGWVEQGGSNFADISFVSSKPVPITKLPPFASATLYFNDGTSISLAGKEIYQQGAYSFRVVTGANQASTYHTPVILVFEYGYAADYIGPYYGNTLPEALAAANAAVPSLIRYIGMPVTLQVGATAYRYWYQNGTANVNLVAQ